MSSSIFSNAFERHQSLIVKRYKLNKQKRIPNPERANRKCLRCLEVFNSDNRGNRICASCLVVQKNYMLR